MKQNQAIRLIFFVKLYGKDTASALPLLNLLDILTVQNVYRLHALKFMRGIKVYCHTYLIISRDSNIQEMFIVTIPDIHLIKTCINHMFELILVSRQFLLEQLIYGRISQI